MPQRHCSCRGPEGSDPSAPLSNSACAIHGANQPAPSPTFTSSLSPPRFSRNSSAPVSSPPPGFLPNYPGASFVKTYTAKASDSDLNDWRPTPDAELAEVLIPGAPDEWLARAEVEFFYSGATGELLDADDDFGAVHEQFVADNGVGDVDDQALLAFDANGVGVRGIRDPD